MTKDEINMKNRFLILVFGAFLLTLVIQGCREDDIPNTWVLPMEGTVGEQVVIAGHNLDQGVQIVINDLFIEPDIVTEENIVFTVPEGAFSGELVIIIGEDSFSKGYFRVFERMEELYSTNNDRIFSIEFVSDDIGYIYNNSILKTTDNGILKTTDGGITWSRLNIEGSNLIDPVRIVSNPSDPKQVWILLQDNFLLRSDDGGDSWSRKPVELGNQADDNSATNWLYVSGDDLFISSEGRFYYSQSKFYHSQDGGDSWEELQGPVGQVIYHQGDEMILLNERDSTEFYSTSDRKEWDKVDCPIKIFRRVSFRTKTEAWAVAVGGRLSKSEDGGKTWVDFPLDFSDIISVYQVLFFNETDGIILGRLFEEEYVSFTARTFDGGKTWSSIRYHNNRFYSIPLFDFTIEANLKEKTMFLLGRDLDRDISKVLKVKF